MAQIQPLSDTGRLTVDFFSGSYRLSANVLVYKRRLVDILANRTTDYLDMVDVYVSRINSPGNIVATYQKGSIVKDQIDFILLSSETETVSKDRFYSQHRRSIPIFLTVPSFEITGRFQWLGDFEIKKVMATDTQKFLAIFEATARNAHFPEVTFQGPAVLVNKSKIQMLCVND